MNRRHKGHHFCCQSCADVLLNEVTSLETLVRLTMRARDMTGHTLLVRHLPHVMVLLTREKQERLRILAKRVPGGRVLLFYRGEHRGEGTYRCLVDDAGIGRVIRRLLFRRQWMDRHRRDDLAGCEIG